MPGHFISIKEIMQHMNNQLPFSSTDITWNWQKATGGAVKHIEMATKCYVKDEPTNKRLAKDKTSFTHAIKNPNHFFNSTVNIRVCAAGKADIRKVHVQLIRRFNGFIVK